MSLLLRIAKSRGLLPRVSDTERAALEAGTVWVDGELLSGWPDFRRILSESYPELTERERPRLARGEKTPRFALTEPEAGSDAASLTSEGVVFRGRFPESQPQLEGITVCVDGIR